MELQTTKRIQLLLTVVLSIILMALIAGYIYYGMQQAKIIALPPSAEPGAPTTTTPVKSATMTREEKMAILNDLTKDAAITTSSNNDKQAILKSLTSDAATSTMTEDQKLKILQSLQ